MVCPNCQSTDVVELQDQHFCINCGRLIKVATKKRAPGRPKAVRLDVAKPLTIKLAAKADLLDKPKEARLEDELSDTGQSLETESPEMENAPIPTDTIPSVKISHSFHTPAPTGSIPSEIAQIAEIKARKRLQDIVPNQDVIDNLESSSSASQLPKKVKENLNLGQIISSAWSEPWQGGPARIHIIAAVIAAIVGALLTFSISAHVSWMLDAQSLIGASSLILGITLLFGVANTERASFALRRYDHRPIPRSWLLGGALAVLGQQTSVVFGAFLDSVVIIGLAIVLAREIPLAMAQPYSSLVLFVAYFLLALLAVAAWVKSGIASAGVELGRMKAAEALKFGWRSLYRHPELLATRLIAALWTAASLAGIIGIGYIVHLFAAQYDLIIAMTVVSLVAFTAVLLGNFGAVGWRQATYREIVIVDETADAIALLSGHHNGAPTRLAHFGYAGVVGLAIVGGIGILFGSIYR